jgi:putative hydrolase of the HAD superfamily
MFLEGVVRSSAHPRAGPGCSPTPRQELMTGSEPLRRPKALLLDLDDTLLDHRVIPENIKNTCELVAVAFPAFDAGLLLEANTRVWAEYWPQVEKAVWLGSIDVGTVSREAWRRTLHACGSDDASILEFTYERSKRLDRTTRRLYPDAAALLACADAIELRLALVTNGPSGLQRDRLHSLWLDDVFDAVIVSAEVGMAKPDAGPFRLALEELGVDTSEAWHIGDSLHTDIVGALGAGLTAVWLNRNGRPRSSGDPRPDLEVRSLLELVPLLHDR